MIRSMSKASLECTANDAGGDGRNGVEIEKVSKDYNAFEKPRQS